MFIPSCEHCGRCGCVCGTLPYTMTVQFSGLVNRTHSRYCELQFTSCFGSGAAAVATSPGGDDPDDRGPLTGVLLLAGGCGYAVLGREEPDVTITGSGVGAVFEATLVEDVDSCDRPVWRFDSVTVEGGTGYAEGERLAVTIDGTVTTEPWLRLKCERGEPTVQAIVSGGSGAVLVVNVVQSGQGTDATWSVVSVDVVEGGDGYVDQASVFFDGGSAVASVLAEGFVVAGSPPAVVLLAFNSDESGPSSGSGAAFQYEFSRAEGGGWLLDVTVAEGGQGYAVDDVLVFLPEGAAIEQSSVYRVGTIDDSGAITSLSLLFQNPMPGVPGPIESVTVTEPGEYFGVNDRPAEVVVDEAGEFFRENPELPPLVADVTVSAAACGGSEEEISVTIGTDPASEDWSKITAISIANGGIDHLAWRWTCTNHSQLNDTPVVLIANSPKKLVTVDVKSCFGGGACVKVNAAGVGETCDPPVPQIYSGEPGPLRGISLASGGSGYAKYGRREPELAISGAAGSGVTFTATFADEPQLDACKLPYWPIDSVSFSGTGQVYPDNSLLQILGATFFDKQHLPATVRLFTRTEPTVTATAQSPGEGATFSVELAENDGTPKTWRVESVSGGGGTGYQQNVAIEFSIADDVVNGVGHFSLAPASAHGTVDDSGAIISIEVLSGGTYWRTSGSPQDVVVEDPGGFYKEDPLLEPFSSSPTAIISQISPSNGSGATIALTVETDTSSPNFGAITGATLTSGGDKYTILGAPLDCSYTALPCVSHPVTLQLRGHGEPPHVIFTAGGGDTPQYIFQATSDLADCSNLPTAAELLYGAPAGSVQISRGGVPTRVCEQPEWCQPCLNPLLAVADLGATEVSFTTTCPCDNGTSSGSGTLDEIDVDCTDDDGLMVPVAIGVELCEIGCNDQGECVYKILVSFQMYVKNPDGDGNLDSFIPLFGAVCTDALSVVEGELQGEVSVSLFDTRFNPPQQFCDADVTFG